MISTLISDYKPSWLGMIDFSGDYLCTLHPHVALFAAQS
jgi:hypothetical protein